jgi:hypothetical protein
MGDGGVSKELGGDKSGEFKKSGSVGDMVRDGLEGVGGEDGTSVQIEIVEGCVKEGEERQEEELSVSDVACGEK